MKIIPLRHWLERRRERADMDHMREVFGPRPTSMIDRWDRAKLIDMIVSGDLATKERAYAESRLRIIEQELGPAGQSARAARLALWLSLASLIVAALALWKSWDV